MNNEQQPEQPQAWKDGYKQGITDATNANKLLLMLHFGNDTETEFRAFMQEIKKPYISTPRKDAQTKFKIYFLTAEQIFLALYMAAVILNRWKMHHFKLLRAARQHAIFTAFICIHYNEYLFNLN